MRIGFVATGGFDRTGRERVIPSLLWLIERLASRHEVVVYVLRYHDAPCTYQLGGATIRDLGRPHGRLRQRAALRRAILEDGPFDILHGYWAQPAGRLVSALGRRLHIPTVVTLDSGEFAWLPQINYGLQGQMRSRFAVREACRADQLTVCSEYQADLARAKGVDARVIPLGVDTSVFVERAQTLPGPPFRLLHVASLNPVKDQATLIRAMRLLVDRGIDVRLDMVGEDTLGGRLQALAGDLHLDDRITFHGFLPSDDLVLLYHAAHLFVLTSLHEAAGVVLLEAAACGVPIVGTDVGYVADWAPERAERVPRADPQQLATTIERGLRDESRTRDMSAQAAAWARAHDAAWTACEFESLYEETIARSRGRAASTSRSWFTRRTTT